MAETNVEKFEQWAIVELFGHSRIAGKVTEQTIGGCGFVRVDVPSIVVPSAETDGRILPGFTRCFGAGAIYSMTFVDEETATLSAAAMRQQPIEPWSARRLLSVSAGEED